MSQTGIAELLREGIGWFEVKEYLEAFFAFDRALKLDPENVLLWGWQGRVLSQISYGHLDDRRDRLPAEYGNTWIAGTDPDTWWQTCHAQAQTCLDRALALAPANPQLWQFLTEFWLQQGYYHNRDEERQKQDYAAALKAIEQAILLDPDNPNLWKTRIEVCRKMWNKATGLESAERLVQLSPGDGAAWKTYAYFLYMMERYDSALESYDRVLSLILDPDTNSEAEIEDLYFGIYLGRGRVLVALGQEEAALASYEQALQYQGYGYLRTEVENLRHRICLRNLDRTIATNPADWEAWYAKAQQYAQQEDYQAAIPCYDRALAIQPNSPDILKERSFAHGWIGNVVAALADIEQALALQPDNLELWDQRGKILANTEQFGPAIDCYDRILSENPNQIDALYSRALAVVKGEFPAEVLVERMNSALENLDHLISIPPELSEGYSEAAAEVWYVRGLVLINLERYADALLSHRRANRWFRPSLENPEDDRASLDALQQAEGWYNWGHFLVCNGYENYREALTLLQRAIELDPSHAQALSFYAYSLLKLKRYKEAVDYYEQALAMQPADARDWHNLGTAHVQMGRYEEAIASFDRALTLSPDDPQTLRCRADVLHHLGPNEQEEGV
uniref:TPR repeat-containing protein n=1 Tax=Cyanothece sp. (strain PCC 7425 / ATCC 29141) TaxID=395961 RepID=B8HKF1_CYAP4